MNEPLVCWIGVLFVALWKWVTSIQCIKTMVLDKVAPKLGGHAYVVEWYSVAILLLSLFLMRTVFDVFYFDYIKDRFLTAPGLQDKVPRDEQEELALPPWLRGAAVFMPCVGIACFILNVYHMCHFVHRQKVREEEEKRKAKAADYQKKHGDVVVDGNGHIGRVICVNTDPNDPHPLKVRFADGTRRWDNWVRREDVEIRVEETNPWHLGMSANLTLLVIMMPAVFVVMAMRAEIRMLQIFLGSSFHQGGNWGSYALWRRCTYAMDLQCAAAFQYLTVVAFARLCSQFFNIDDLTKAVEITEMKLILRNNQLQYALDRRETQSVESSLRVSLKEADDEHRYSLKYAGLQGLWSYIIVGFIRCIFAIVMAGLMELKEDSYKKLLVGVLDHYQPVFVFTAVLCIYNWTIIQNLRDIKRDEALGKSATFKFIAVRVLLLVGDGQKTVLQSFVGRRWLGLSARQGDLLHAILLLFECALVVTWNLFMWHYRAVGKRTSRGSTSSEAGSGLDDPLLP